MLSQDGLKRPVGCHTASTKRCVHATRNLTVAASTKHHQEIQQHPWQLQGPMDQTRQIHQFQMLPCTASNLELQDNLIQLKQAVRLKLHFPMVLIAILNVAFHVQVFSAPTAAAAELLESSIQAEGNVPSELSAAGEQQGPRLSSLMEGSNRKQIEGCTRSCVPTCIRGGEGSPGLGPISIRKEIVVFKDGFRSRQYCLSECAQVCKLLSDTQQQEPQQQKQKQQ